MSRRGGKEEERRVGEGEKKKHPHPVVIIMTFMNQLWVAVPEVQFIHYNSTKYITLK
jgi:hypothetical protein